MHAELERSFLQARVAKFAVVLGITGIAGFVVRALAHLGIGGSATSFLGASFLFHAIGPLVLLALWVGLGRGERSERTVQRAEEVGLVLHAAAYAALTTQLDLEARPEYAGLLVLVLVMMARAVFVPSTPRRTLLLTLLVGAVFLTVTSYDYNFLRADLAGLPTHAPFTRPLTASIWWAFVVGLCTLATSVIYGLRLEVRQARKLGQYTLEKPIGRGGMGIVYRARHAMLRRPTAVKLLLPSDAQASRLARFEREVQLTSQLSHPNTVRVYDYGRTPEGVFYYAMEYLDGADLDAVVAVGGPMPAPRVVRILSQLAGALAEAHAAGLIHRDIKPANVLLTEQGGEPDVAKVVDFGLLKWLGQDEPTQTTGGMPGTPHYIAPEALEDPEAVGPAADLYSLGAVGYFLLTGSTVFPAGPLADVLEAHRETPPMTVSERLAETVPDAAKPPADLETIIMSCLHKDPAERPADALDLQAWLLACEDAFDWTSEDARAWWQEHRQAVSEHRAHRVEGATTFGSAHVRRVLTTSGGSKGQRPLEDVRIERPHDELLHALSGVREIATSEVSSG